MLHLQRDDTKKLMLLGFVFLVAGVAEMLNYTSFMAIFNTRMGIAMLPVMYIVEAIILPIEGWLLSLFSQKAAKHKFMTGLYILFLTICTVNGVCLLLFKWFQFQWVWFYIVLFLTSNFVIRQQTLLMWSAAFDLCPTQQAKRLMPGFVILAIIGGIIAGIISSSLGASLGSEYIYLLGALLLACGLPNFIKALRKYLVPLTFQQEEAVQSEKTSFYWKNIAKSPFLLMVIGIMTLMPALYFVMEYQYFTNAQAVFTEEGRLTSFYGLMVIILFVAALILQIIATKLMDKLGATNMIVIISFIFLGCLVLSSLFVSSHIALVIASLGYSLTYLLLYYFAEPSYQFFFKMLPIHHRDGYRYLAQGIAASLGILAGSLMSMLHSSFELSMNVQAMIALVFAAVLCVIAWLTKSLYMKELMNQLQLTAVDRDYLAEFWSYIRTDKFRKFLQLQLEQGTRAMKHVLMELVRRQPDQALDAYIMPYADKLQGESKVQALQALHSSTWASFERSHYDKLVQDRDAGVRAISYHYLFKQYVQEKDIVRALADEHVWVQREAWYVMPSDEDLYRRLREQLQQQQDGAIYAMDVIVARNLEHMTMDVMYSMLSEIQAVKLAAVKAMGKLGDEELVPSFMELLLGADIEMRQAIKQSLCLLAFKSKQELIRFVQSPNALQWSMATEVLRTVATEQELSEIIIPSCLTKLQEISASHMMYAEILKTKQAQWVELAKQRTEELVSGQLDTIWDVMSDYSDERAITKLREALEHPEEEIRDQGLEVLAEGYGQKALSEGLLHYYREQMNTEQAMLEIDNSWFEQIKDPWLQAIAIKSGAEKGEQLLMSNWEYLSSIEKIVFLKQVPLFEKISIEELGRIASIAEEARYEANDMIVTQGELGDRLYIVKSGLIEISGENDQGIIGTLNIVQEKQSFGESSLFASQPSQVTAQILLDEAELLEIKANELLKLIRLYPEIGIGLLKTVSQRMSNLEQMVVKMS